MTKFIVKIVKYDMDKTTKRSRKNLLVNEKSEQAVIKKLEEIHKGEKVVTIHEIIWDEESMAEESKISAAKKNTVYSGEIKFFDQEKGYGFITPDSDMDDLFFHTSALKGQEIQEHDLVDYEIGESPKGSCAIHIKVLGNNDNNDE